MKSLLPSSQHNDAMLVGVGVGVGVVVVVVVVVINHDKEEQK